MKKLTLNQIRIKSFIIEQETTLQYTVKAGAFGSDGPPHTSSPPTEGVCSTGQPSVNYCVASEFCASGNCTPHQTINCESTTVQIMN